MLASVLVIVLLATRFWPPSATVVSAEPFLHGTGTLRCLQKETARLGLCPTLLNAVLWQSWMAVCLGYTLQMKTLFPGWPIMVHDTHTRRRKRCFAKMSYKGKRSSYDASFKICLIENMYSWSKLRGSTYTWVSNLVRFLTAKNGSRLMCNYVRYIILPVNTLCHSDVIVISNLWYFQPKARFWRKHWGRRKWRLTGSSWDLCCGPYMQCAQME